MTPEERERLIEQAASAWRPRDPDGGVRAHPAWHDLDLAARAEAWEAALATRALESALDADGLSSTARAVLSRITAAV
jgi:hypothetical protein